MKIQTQTSVQGKGVTPKVGVPFPTSVCSLTLFTRGCERLNTRSYPVQTGVNTHRSLTARERSSELKANPSGNLGTAVYRYFSTDTTLAPVCSALIVLTLQRSIGWTGRCSNVGKARDIGT